jgi:hypothetical protein
LQSKYALRIYVPEVLRFSSRPLLKLTWSLGEFLLLLLLLLLAKLFVLVILLLFYFTLFFLWGGLKWEGRHKEACWVSTFFSLDFLLQLLGGMNRALFLCGWSCCFWDFRDLGVCVTALF